MKIINPATAELIREVAEDSAASVADQYRRARAAQPAWAAVPLAEKLARLRAFREILVRDAEGLARTLTMEVGKPIALARN
jgi:acyl-CoA reductase-like NAD-dependent aldehyde dehydrogenase